MNDKNVRSADLPPRNGNLIKILSAQANESFEDEKSSLHLPFYKMQAT
jgi:hypothetical protein